MKNTFLLFLIIVSHYTLSLKAQDETSLFFSEYTANGYTNVLEIFNPTADTVELNRYSIVRNGSFRFDFPGGVLLPFKSWVGCRNEPANPPDPTVLAVADTSWPATGSIWYFSSTAMIELLRDGEVIDRINGDPRNAVVAGVEAALDKHTLIRKPSVFKGETNWNISRGTNADDSQWLVFPVTYADLKKHNIDLPDPTLDSTAILLSDLYPILEDTIFLTSPTPVDTVRLHLSTAGKGIYVLLDILGNAVGSGMVRSGSMARVIAEAGNSKLYTFIIEESEEAKIEIESFVYSIQADSLSGISRGTSLENLQKNLLLFPEGVSMKLTGPDGIPKTGGVDTGDKIELTARNGDSRKVLSLVCHDPVLPAAFQVHKVAKPRIMPVGAPAYSDVNFTSRWARTIGLMAGPLALPAAKSFHATNFRWVYITNRPANNYPGTDYWVSNEVKGNGFRIAASLNPSLPDFPKGGGNGYDSKAEMQDGTTTTTFCPNKPLGKQVFLNHVMAAIEMGSDYSIQMDDPHSYTDEEAVCYCRFCKDKAKEWGMSVGTKAFKEKTVSEFWKWIQSETVKYTGIRIGYSCNNSSNHLFDAVTRQFDFMIGECDPRWGYGADKYFADERLSAEPLGKMQVYNLSIKGLVIEDPTLVWRNRSMIGLAYGTGGNCIVPWDTWMHPPIEERRYFGAPGEYADLFGFIRANSRLLEGYQTAFDYMPNYNDPRYGGEKVFTITGNERAFAWVRAVPGDSSAAAVVHLVDWRESPGSLPMTVNIKAEYFFDGQDFGVYLVEPVSYDAMVHKSVITNADNLLKPGTFRGAEHEAVYSPLRKITRLNPVRNGSTLSFSLDSIPTYATLVLVPALNNIWISSEDLMVNQEEMYIKGYEPSIYTSELLAKLDRSPLTSWMILDAKGFPVYNEVPQNASLVVLSPEGRKMAQYALYEGEANKLELSCNSENIPSGGSYTLEGVAVGASGEEYAFTLKNLSSEVFRPDTLMVENEAFMLQYTFKEIPSGGSANFTLKFKPGKKGHLQSKLWIKNELKSKVPFVITISGEGLSAGMEVYNEGNLLKPGTGILNMGSVKIDRDSLIELSVLNNGSIPLLISGIQSSKPGVVSLAEFDASIDPGASGSLKLKFSPSAAIWEAVKVTILNSSTPFGEYVLNAEGFGLDLIPEMKVEYNTALFSNNSGVVDFGNVKLNETETRKVVIRNSGIDNLYITNIVSGMANFEIVSKPEVVPPGEEDTIIIHFTPTLQLSYSTQITINSNDTGNGTFKFTVKGKGIDVTGTGEPGLSNLLIYPNPATEFLKVSYPGTYNLRMIDLSGKVVVNARDCSEEYEMNVSALRGIFILEVIANEVYLKEKVIIQ